MWTSVLRARNRGIVPTGNAGLLAPALWLQSLQRRQKPPKDHIPSMPMSLRVCSSQMAPGLVHIMRSQPLQYSGLIACASPKYHLSHSASLALLSPLHGLRKQANCGEAHVSPSAICLLATHLLMPIVLGRCRGQIDACGLPSSSARSGASWPATATAANSRQYASATDCKQLKSNQFCRGNFGMQSSTEQQDETQQRALGGP